MSQNFTTYKGYIFRLFLAQESDQIVHLLTTQGSRQVLAAKGARKNTSRKAHALDLLNLVEVKAVERGEIPTISEIKLVDQNLQIKQGYTNLIFAQFVCELIHLHVQGHAAEPGFARNLENLLAVTSIQKPLLLGTALMLRFLYVAGLLPELNIDIQTGTKLDQKKIWPLNDPGFTNTPQAIQPLNPRLIKSLQFCMRATFTQTQQLDLSLEEQQILFNLLRDWTQTSLQAALRSANLLLDSIINQ